MDYDLDLPLALTRRGQVHPGPPLHANQRLHRFVEAKLKRMVRHAAHWQAKQAAVPCADHIEVGLHYAPGSIGRGQFDPSNLMPCQKPALDGVVDAGVVPNDTPQYVTELMPTIHTGPGPRRLWLRITITREATP
ncbi:hypothetical protein [Actinokineospora enzanensis]|uniref:hypothetical protein n=1 Tax=Actinokineospora enzanensis TaxID=155975 RepID=UPI000363C922|nr:hypothetical protein [Actinokineospora enzanensis]